MAVLRTGWCQSTNEMQWMDKEERWHLFFPRIFQRSIFLLLQSPTPTSSTGLLHQSHCHSSHDRISHKTFERFDRLTFSNCAAIDSRCQPPFLFIHIFEAIGEKWGGKNYILVVVEIYRRRWNVNDDVGTLSRSNWSAIFVGFQNRFSLSPWISNANRVIWSKYSNRALSISTKQFSFHETQNCEMINASKYKLKHEIHISTTKLLSSIRW